MSRPLFTIENDPQYGTFWMECIGVVDYMQLLMELDAETLHKWRYKFHPVKYLRTHNCETLHEHLNKSGQPNRAGRYAYFVPTAAVNKDWDFRGCEYGKQVGGRKRAMPLIMSEKKIEKWQASLPDRMLVPDWLEGCKTMADVLEADKHNNPLPCSNCGRGT